MKAPNLFFTFLLILFGFSSFAQSLPVGTPILEESLRRMQIKGEIDPNTSFTVRPIHAYTDLNFDTIYYPNDSLGHLKNNNLISFSRGKGRFILLPVTLRQEYNIHHPYGWNDGSMIPAKGYQSQISAGFYSKLGPFSIQLQPELVYAQNKNFSTLPLKKDDSITASYYLNVLNRIDAPEKYGNRAYLKLFPGESSFRLNYKKLSAGISTENLWWGPGIRNSLIMSNNAPGFPHLTFNTTAPVRSSIGSFEWQLISGYLKGSGILPDTTITYDGQKLYLDKKSESRYLNGMIITWQPKWTKGLYVGFSRVFYLYQSDVQPTINGYLPVFGKFFKSQPSIEDSLKRDQILSLFFRLILPKEKAEIYAEFGRNDHSGNLRDLLLEPEHSRAYIIGFRKIFERSISKEIELLFELTNLQFPSTGQLRDIPTWYEHHQVLHGYTNLGQVMGAGIGPGGSSQTLGLNWLKGIGKFGAFFERVVWNNDFYYNAFESSRDFGRHWVDLSLNLNKSWQHNHFIYDANMSLIRSFNYQWRRNIDVTNLHATLSVSYLF